MEDASGFGGGLGKALRRRPSQVHGSGSKGGNGSRTRRGRIELWLQQRSDSFAASRRIAVLSASFGVRIGTVDVIAIVVLVQLALALFFLFLLLLDFPASLFVRIIRFCQCFAFLGSMFRYVGPKASYT